LPLSSVRLCSIFETLKMEDDLKAVARRPKLEAETVSQSGRVSHISFKKWDLASEIQSDAKIEEAEVTSPTSNQKPRLRKC
jgi:hypothetical protein